MITKTAITALALFLCAAGQAAQPALDNDRFTVWDTKEVLPPSGRDFVAVSLAKEGSALYGHKGDRPGVPGEHTIVISWKDTKTEPLQNPGPYPNAFPRAHTKKLFENDNVIVWDTRWMPGEPTPVHFHDKDALVVYESVGVLKSTTPDGKSEEFPVKVGGIRFGTRGRTHSEVLVSGRAHAVITELK